MLGKTSTRLAVLAALFIGSGSVFADVITFDDLGLVHGEILTTQIPGLTVSAINPNRSFNIAAIFDTTETGTADPDLQDPWDTGNLPANTVIGNVVFIAENDHGDEDGVLDDPDDEGDRPAGSLIFTFSFPINSIGFDLVDIEGVGAGQEPGDFAVVRMDNSIISTISFASLMASDGAVFGDNSLNRIAPRSFGESFNTLEIHLGGSGAIDNLVFTRQAPAPGAMALFGLGLGLLGLVRRAKRD